MITQKEYEKQTEKYWLGKKVITQRELKNGNVVIPAGTVLAIRRKYKGFTLDGVKECPYCKIGRLLYIAKVPPMDVSLLEEK